MCQQNGFLVHNCYSWCNLTGTGHDCHILEIPEESIWIILNPTVCNTPWVWYDERRHATHATLTKCPVLHASQRWAHEHMSCTARSARNIRHFAVESHLNANPAPRRMNPWHNWAHNCSIFVGHNSSYHWAAPWKTSMPCSCCSWSTSLSPTSQADWMHPSHNIWRTLSFRRARLATLQAVG